MKYSVGPFQSQAPHGLQDPQAVARERERGREGRREGGREVRARRNLWLYSALGTVFSYARRIADLKEAVFFRCNNADLLPPPMQGPMMLLTILNMVI